MRVSSGLVFLCGCLLASISTGAERQPSPASADETFQWPGGARAAVNLAYDDALPSQLDYAIQALDRYGFNGSFYLTLSSETVRERLPEWRAAAARGHELGNHSLFHPCSASGPDRQWVLPHLDLDNMTVQEFRDRLELASTFLHAIDGEIERTFTTPCGDLDAGGEPYIDAIKPMFIAIKSQFDDGVTESMAELDPWSVHVVAPSEVSGEQLIAIVQQAAEQGTMANFTFHGVGGDYLSVSREAHDALLAHLAAHSDIYWVDSFINIMRFVHKRSESWTK